MQRRVFLKSGALALVTRCLIGWKEVEEGVEVIVERDHRPVATIRTPRRSGRLISECIASARASGSKIVLDRDFGRDVEEGIRERSKPWNPPSWD